MKLLLVVKKRYAPKAHEVEKKGGKNYVNEFYLQN